MADIVMSEKSPLVANEHLHYSGEHSDSKKSEKSEGVSSDPNYERQISKTNSDEKPKKSFSQMSRRSKIILILCTIAQLLASCASSLLGPFYPIEAEKKGMSVTLTGFVFGLFELLIFIFSPLYGNFLTQLGPKFCYIAGVLVGGTCNIIFGTLNKSPSGTPFIATSIACRTVEALGFSGFITTSFAIVSSEFPDNVGFVYGILELGAGCGYMIGPVLGGALYELGGYGLPFYVVGALILVNGCLMFAFLPTPKVHVAEKRQHSLLYLLRSPLVIISLFSVLCGSTGITVFAATLAQHMQKFNVSTGIVSLFFSLVAILYSVMATVWGHITDKKDIQAPLIIGGHLIFGIGFLIIGPSQILSFIPSELWTLGIGLALIGFSFGCTLIPTMKCMLKGACSLGFGNNLGTNAMVSGLFNSASHLGGFFGPVGGDALIAAKGYSFTYTAVGFLHLFAMLVQIAFVSFRYIMFRKRGTVEGEETEIAEKIKGDSENSVSLRRTSRAYPRSLSISVSEQL